MSVEMNETLSAMVDGEANELETRRALKNMSDEESQTWQRYQTVSSVIQQDKNLFLGSDISAAVSSAIANEALHKAASTFAWKPLASFAVAASITMAVFVGLQLDNGADVGVSADIAAVDTATAEAASRVSAGSQGLSLTANEGFATASAQLESQNTQLIAERAIADAIAAERLQTYMEQHTAHSAHNSNQGVLPFARVEEAQTR